MRKRARISTQALTHHVETGKRGPEGSLWLNLPRPSAMLGAGSVPWPRGGSGSRCDSCEGGTDDADEEEDEEEEAALDLECRSFSLRRFSGVTVSAFTGVGCSVAGATGKKLSRLSFVCFGVVGASPVNCTKRGSSEKMPARH